MSIVKGIDKYDNPEKIA